jgi:hypothetical protein
MINFKKGPALSLRQTNFIGKPVAGNAIEAGHVVRVFTAAGASLVEVARGANSGTGAVPGNVLLGFAINDQTDGDVVESGRIGVFGLDGASVVETDKYETAVATAAIGTPLTTNDSGNLTTIAATGGNAGSKVVGWVEGFRTLPRGAAGAAVTFVAVKLNA